MKIVKRCLNGVMHTLCKFAETLAHTSLASRVEVDPILRFRKAC